MPVKAPRKVSRMNIFVRFQSDSSEFCHWPIMQDRRNRRDYYVGGLCERYPTEYTKRRIGAALAFALRMTGVAHVQVKEAFPEEGEYDHEGGGVLNSCPGDVGARDSL